METSKHLAHSCRSALIHTRRRLPVHIAGLLSLLLVLAACSTSTTNGLTPTRTPNNFTAFSLGLPAAALNAPIKGPLPDNAPLHVGITFKVNQAVLNQLKKAGKGTDLETKNLGISDDLYQKIKAYFGVTNAKLRLDGLHTYLTVDASAKTFAQVFQTSFVLRTFNGRTFYAPTSDPMVPNFLYPSILAITGLDNFAPPPQPHKAGQVRALPLASTHNPLSCYPMQTLQALGRLYGFDQIWQQGWQGQKMSFNLIEFGPANMQELNYFSNCARFQGQLKTINVNGGPNPANRLDQETAFEAMLDIELAQAFAPATNINVYQSTFGNVESDFWTNMNDMLRRIVADNEKSIPAGSIVSISYIGAEQYVSTSLRQAIDQSFSLLTNTEHMTVFAASGDCSAFSTQEWGTLGVEYPASSPYVVSVGGTHVLSNASGKRSTEEVWSDGSDKRQCTNQWGSGGGNSTVYPRPSWQTGPGVESKYAENQRQVPDVSAVAIDVPMYYQSQWFLAYGTSAATPIWAAGFLLLNQELVRKVALPFYGPNTFYLAATDQADQPFYDIMQGNDGYFPATPGWDYATGLGSPNLPGLDRALQLILIQRLGL